MNQVDITELKVNMVTILNSETALALAADLPSMPSEEEMVDIFMPVGQNTSTSSQTDDEGNTATAEEHEVRINEPCVVIWDVNDHREWYIGMCVSDNGDDSYVIEHLERYRSHLDYKENEHRLWRYPEKPDIQTVTSVQLIPCTVVGSWNHARRVMIFQLENWQMIDVLFQSFY